MEFHVSVKDRDTGQDGVVFGAVKSTTNTAAVSLKVSGKTMFYCVNCGRMYEPTKSCPECGAQEEK